MFSSLSRWWWNKRLLSDETINQVFSKTCCCKLKHENSTPRTRPG
jgi:hypothetical protein